ncbi:hypothetical protein QFZ80_003066 [Paenibacillus sp. V4I7]|nr:hypothetical protein [Paenibacillus sp. V4I7]
MKILTTKTRPRNISRVFVMVLIKTVKMFMTVGRGILMMFSMYISRGREDTYIGSVCDLRYSVNGFEACCFLELHLVIEVANGVRAIKGIKFKALNGRAMDLHR